MSHALKQQADDVQNEDLRLKEIESIYQAIDKVQAIIEFDLSGRILRANENFCRALGYRLEEIQGKHHRIFCTDDVRESLEYRRFWEKLNRGEFDTGEYKRIKKDGSELWINASYNPVFDNQGKLVKVIKFATDITREKLKNLEFSSTLDAVSKAQAVIEFNMDGSIISANENFLMTLGYSLAEIQGKHHSMFCDEGTASSRA